MNSIKGRALLKITREDSKWVPYHVETEILECDNPLYEPTEDFQLLETDTLPCPDAAYKLKVGETVEVEVDYVFTYTRDYEGEVDCELEYERQKVV